MAELQEAIFANSVVSSFTKTSSFLSGSMIPGRLRAAIMPSALMTCSSRTWFLPRRSYSSPTFLTKSSLAMCDTKVTDVGGLSSHILLIGPEQSPERSKIRGGLDLFFLAGAEGGAGRAVGVAVGGSGGGGGGTRVSAARRQRCRATACRRVLQSKIDRRPVSLREIVEPIYELVRVACFSDSEDVGGSSGQTEHLEEVGDSEELNLGVGNHWTRKTLTRRG